MDILLTGSSGLVGTELQGALRHAGHAVRPVVRRADPADDAASAGVLWDPVQGIIDLQALEKADAVVHLAGESIASGRWSEAKKRRIRDSRVIGTNGLCQAMTQCSSPPRVLISASAIGYYGSRGAEELDERSGPGGDFLAQVCQQWEEATTPARDAGVRVVNLRIGVVLSAAGGALAKMLTPFRFGLGGRIGSGDQYMSWVALPELVAIIADLLGRDEVTGPVNAVAPQPVNNREFTRTLGAVLGRPTLFPVPATIARLAMGEMADALLLSSSRVVPRCLQEAGYAFRWPGLEGALRHVLGRE